MGIGVMNIKSISLFEELPDEDLQAISELAVTRQYPKNTLVMCEGDRSDSLYIVLSGKVKVFLNDEEGKEVTLNIQGEGEYFGELAMLDNAPRSASVMTLEKTRLAVVSKSAFDECLECNPKIALTVIQGLARRLRELTENVRSLALMDVYGRVAHTLLDLAEEKDGKLVVTQRLTQRDIASMVGASREMVSRILRDLTVGGYITSKNKIITINERLPSAW
ncbi:cAMP-binding proteins - catabolite gene activator and regulatory subunit of cAMP-dependent protein kinases [hydrothermal vent metagenome]|uniref:cAMP-binding proteins - catabolite gene activator and regulatory subunit of cAMP-dependent protein kinases n=1 Tax=hydrothermal vent metagenome TaxID=652676 RepID=A0A3B1ATU6_9ZZZZ